MVMPIGGWMAIDERIQAARVFLNKSSAEFAAGDNRQGSDILWQAATHVVMGLAQARGWECDSHRAPKNAAERLGVEFGDQSIGYGFSAAEKFHWNSYHNFMEDFELESDRPVVHEFVERMLAYHESS